MKNVNDLGLFDESRTPFHRLILFNKGLTYNIQNPFNKAKSTGTKHTVKVKVT